MKKAKIRCPSCGSSQAYIRLKTGQIVCKECGEISQIQKPSSTAFVPGMIP